MTRRILLLTLALVLLASAAYAHGGSYRGPSWPPAPTPPNPVTPEPRIGPTPTLPDPGGTTTPPPSNLPAPPPTLNPPTPTGANRQGLPPPPSDPTTTGGGASSWVFWWTLNRERILNLRKLQIERLAQKTTTPGTHFLGEPGENKEPEDKANEAFQAILEALLAAARDDNRDVATGAIVALGKAGDHRAIPLLMKLAADPRADRTVHESSVLALGMIGDRRADVRRFLATIAGDVRRPARTRSFAVLGLGFLGDLSAIPTLMARASTKESRYDVPACAYLGLGLLGDEIVLPDLLRAVAGQRGGRVKDNVLRAHATAALGMLRSRAALNSLYAALADKNVEVRRQAVLSVGALAEPEDDHALKALAHVLANDSDPQARGFAAVSLGEIGAPAAANTLRYAILKGSHAVEPYSALGLGLLIRNSEDPAVRERVLPFLRKRFVESGNADVKGALAISLGIAGDREAIKPLLKLVNSRSQETLRGHAAVALGLIGAEEALPSLRKALEERSSPTVQREVALALGLIGDREAERILSRLVREARTEYVRGSAAVALGRLASPETAEELRKALADRDLPDTTRAFIAVALGHVMDRREFPLLSRLGEHYNHRMAVEAVVEALTFL